MPTGKAAGKPVEFHRKIKLLPDGSMHSANKISEMFGVPQCSISRKFKAGKKVWTRDELREWVNRLKSDPRRIGGFRSKPAPTVIRNIDDVEYNPSAMERALMGVR